MFIKVIFFYFFIKKKEKKCKICSFKKGGEIENLLSVEEHPL